MKRPLVIAHRGASGYAPENTMAAFQLAQELGSDGLEFDVQLTRDGIPVVIHDELLTRTTGYQGYVGDLNLNELSKLDAGGWMSPKWKGEPIPTLEQVLQKYNGLFLNVELKNSKMAYPGLEEKVIELVLKYCKPDQVILSSFNHQSVQKLKQIAPTLPTGLLYSTEPKQILNYAIEIGAFAVHPDYKLLSQARMESYIKQGLHVNTWTVNESRDMEFCIKLGVDGIITNYPDRLHSMLNRI